jgi:triphosphoribosyl-dephospho-CoA synthase
MALLALFPDSHVARKHGPETAAAVQHEAAALAAAWSPVVVPRTFSRLLDFDADLKQRGINPGTTADFVVATLFTGLLEGSIASPIGS